MTITAEQSRSRSYRRALKAEISGHMDESALQRCPINHPALLSYKANVLGGRDTCQEYADWTEFLVEGHGPRRRCLSLGSGIGRVEQYLIRRGFTGEFESIELNPSQVDEANTRDQRIGAVVGDLNFVNLAPRDYDFILCHGVLHHLINLEHVLDQVNRALTEDGLLLIYEYVGPDRWQYPRAQLDHLDARHGLQLRNRPVWAVSGFETIRSFDLLRLLQHYWGQTALHTVNYGSAFHPVIHCGGWPDAKPRVGEIIAHDQELARSGTFPPSYHMGLYRKSTASSAEARPWPNEELAARAAPHVPWPALAQHFARRVRARAALRKRAKQALRFLRTATQ